jgi:predicted nucleic acid-binding protein
VNLVIDASVVIKFYVPEILTDHAEEILSRSADGELRLYAPDLVYPETGNILWKKRRRRELTSEEVDAIVDAIAALPIIIEASKQIMPLAVSIAVHNGITVYDAMYMAIARIYDTKMITADKKLTDALAKTEFKKYVQWLGTGV